jgi:hypothetical protein
MRALVRDDGRHAAVAQLVEQRTFNPTVAGSSPAGGIEKRPYIGRFVLDGDVAASKSCPQYVPRSASDEAMKAPPAGWYTKRTAEAELRDVLDQARRGTLPGTIRTGVTFADAAAEWMRFIEQDRERKPSTLKDYRSVLNAYLLPAFADRPIEAIDPRDIERWRAALTGLSNRSKNKLLIQMHGIFRRAQIVWGIPANPLARVESAGRTAGSPLPRPAPHVRDADDHEGGHPPRAGVDGPRGHPDHDALPPRRASPPGRGARGRGIQARGGYAPCV